MKGFGVSQRTIARLLTNSWVLACNVQARELEMLRQRQERAELQQALEMKEQEVSCVVLFFVHLSLCICASWSTCEAEDNAL